MNSHRQADFLQNHPILGPLGKLTNVGLIYEERDAKIIVGFWPKPFLKLENSSADIEDEYQWLVEEFLHWERFSKLTSSMRKKLLAKIIASEHAEGAFNRPELSPSFSQLLRYYKRRKRVSNFLNYRPDPHKLRDVTQWENSLPRNMRRYWEKEKLRSYYQWDSGFYEPWHCPIFPFIVQLSGSPSLRNLFDENPALAVWTVGDMVKGNLFAACQKPFPEIDRIARLPVTGLLGRLNLPATMNVAETLKRLDSECWTDYFLETFQRIARKEEALKILCTAPFMRSGFLTLRWTINWTDHPLAYFTMDAWHEIFRKDFLHIHRFHYQPFLKGPPPVTPFSDLPAFSSHLEK